MNNEREKWLKDRTNGIGGSDASVVMGINPWKSRLQLWEEKVTGNIVEIDNPDTYWGKILEPVIAQEYTKETGRHVYIPDKFGFSSNSLIHKDYPFIMATPDRIIDVDTEILSLDIDKRTHGILEIKTKSAWSKWENDEIPLYYQMQLQHYLAVTGFSWGSFCVLDMGKKDLIIKDFNRDEKLITELIEKEKEFWELVQNKTPPKIDSSKATEQFLRDKYSEGKKGKTMDLTNNKIAQENTLALQIVRTKIKNLDEEETQCKNILMSIMGDAEIGIGLGYKIVWKSPKDKIVFNEEEFKKYFPDIYNQYLELKPQSRRFNIKF